MDDEIILRAEQISMLFPGTLALDRPEAGGLRLRVRLPIRPPVATEDRT